MNTRGLIELVVLNIGYDMGILSSEIFTMMILMALTTTFMAGPLFRSLKFEKKKTRSMQNQSNLNQIENGSVIKSGLIIPKKPA
jgi:K+:H+ antiporter